MKKKAHRSRVSISAMSSVANDYDESSSRTQQRRRIRFADEVVEKRPAEVPEQLGGKLVGLQRMIRDRQFAPNRAAP